MLRARVRSWCHDGRCYDVFSTKDISCDGCPIRDAPDPRCTFDGDRAAYGSRDHLTDASVSAPIDASVSEPLVFVDRTPSAPILTAPLGTSSDCGKYLVGVDTYQIFGDFWHPSTVTVGTNVYLTMPCKYADTGGWDLGLARVSLGLADYSNAGTWIDGNAVMPGVNEFVNTADLDVNGTTLGSLGFLTLATDGSGLFGIGGVIVGANFAMTPLTLGQPEDLAGTRYDLTRSGTFDFASDDSTWRGATATDRAILFNGGVYNVLNVTYDEPAETSTFLSVTTTTDGVTPLLPTAPLRAQLSHPVIAMQGTQIFLIAIDDSAGRYVVIRGASIAELATAPATPLGLDVFRGTPGSWNYDLYAYTPSGEPRIVGAAIDGNSLLLFYWAGAGEFTAATAPYTASRSIGVLAATI